jgi:hypothetical protein
VETPDYSGCTVAAMQALEHDPEKLALGLDPSVDTGFSEKVMLQQRWEGR